MARRIQRKELRKPDEFVDVGARVLNWIADHRTALGIAVATVLVLVFGVMLVTQLRRSANVEEWRPLLSAVPVRAMPEGEEPDPLALLGRQDPAEFVDGQKLRSVAEAGDSDVARKLADLAVAAELLGKGDGAGAERRYRAYLSLDTDAKKESLGRLIAQEGLGYALERQNKSDEAAAAFAAIGDLAQGAYRALALYHQGRLAALAGRDEDARKVFLEAKSLENPRPQDVVPRVESWLRQLELRKAPAAPVEPPPSVPPAAPAPEPPVIPPAVAPPADDAGASAAPAPVEPEVVSDAAPAPGGDASTPQADAPATNP